MNHKDKSLSNQLEYTQQAIDALAAMPPALRNRLAEQASQQRALKAALESRVSEFDKQAK